MEYQTPRKFVEYRKLRKFVEYRMKYQGFQINRSSGSEMEQDLSPQALNHQD